MAKEDLRWIVGIVIGLVIGAIGTYVTLKVDGAVLDNRVTQLETCSLQSQSEISTLRLSVSKTQQDIKNADKSYQSLQKVIKELADSNRGLSTAITRIDERQKYFEEFLKQYLQDRR